MQTISPMAIMKIGNMLHKAAMEQTAKDAGVSIEELSSLMESDASVAKRFRDYIVSGFNFATGSVDSWPLKVKGGGRPAGCLASPDGANRHQILDHRGISAVRPLPSTLAS